MNDERCLRVTSAEQTFLNLLLEFAHAGDACPTKSPIRVAGGWVRDKLLDRSSSDLDIALEDVTGQTFASAFQKWLYATSKMAQIRTMVVKANPEKSKHLETAVMSLPSLGLSIDLVNLRSETYAADSRIPCMEFGTPVEDAYRRDFTINSLFYNVQSGEVEDFTRMGLLDLDKKMLRTPVDPLKTFLDDPLRVIRAIRFLGKLEGFVPDPALQEAASDPQVHSALRSKVTKDRVRQEFLKVFEAPNVKTVLRLLHQWKINADLFQCSDENEKAAVLMPHPLPSDPKPLSLVLQDFELGTILALGLESALDFVSALPKEDAEEILAAGSIYWKSETYKKADQRGVAVFAALLWELAAYEISTKKTRMTLAEDVLINLKCKGLSTQMASVIVIARDFIKLLEKETETQTEITFDELAGVLRREGAARWWEIALILASTFRVVTTTENWSTAMWDQRETIERVISSAKSIRHLVHHKYRMDGVIDMKPILPGHQLKRIFTKLPGGPVFGSVMKAQTSWMLTHWQPDEIEREKQKEELTAHLKSMFDAYI